MKIVGVIPARYASSRFPGKPLADICGKPMIWWVYQQAKKVKKFDEVYVATDDKRIIDVCVESDMNVLLTSNFHETSTERLYEVCNKINADLYVCINGDEPLIDPKIIEKILPDNYFNTENCYVRNLMTKICNPVHVIDTTNIKVVTDIVGDAIYMSRNAVPFPKSSVDYNFYKHLGVLIYNLNALKFFVSTEKGKNELVEDINELRFIENGVKIKMIDVESESLSVDTPKDLEYVRKIIQEKINNGELQNE